jgi:hypothetical protein
MRATALCVALLAILAVSHSVVADVRDPGLVNKILMYGTFETPDLEAGQQGVISFDFTNPYNDTMTGIVLNASIYQYVEQQTSIMLDSTWTHEYPKLEGASDIGREAKFTLSTLERNASARVNFTVLTSSDMPHGGIFSQGSYLVRFWLTFVFDGAPVKMASPGYWSKEQFMWATQEGAGCISPGCVGQVNLTRLGGIDGILPDSAFGVKDIIPQWPFYLFGSGAIFFLLLAVLYYAEENPSKLPRTARAFAGFKGRLVRTFRPRKGRKSR